MSLSISNTLMNIHDCIEIYINAHIHTCTYRQAHKQENKHLLKKKKKKKKKKD